VRQREIGPKSESSLARGSRLVEAADLSEEVPEAGVGLRRIRVETDRFEAGFDRLGGPTERCKCLRQIQAQAVRARQDAQSTVIAGNRLLRLVLRDPGAGEIQMRVEVIRLQRNCSLEARCRFRQSSLLHPHVAQIVVRGWIGWIPG